MIKIIKIIMLMLISFFANAENSPENEANDKRLKTVAYRVNDIIPINAIYKQATLIDLGSGNIITDVIAGDSDSWLFELTAGQDGILAKPLTYNSDTNLIIITNKRKYFFDLKRSSKNKTYGVRFVYPDEKMRDLKAQLKINKATAVNSDLDINKSFPDDWNFGYILKGNKESSPVNVFDDGKFTYLDFGKKEVPAIFAVDKDKQESVINFHKSGKYLVVENIYQQLTMRNGTYSTCIYNKSYKHEMSSDVIELKNNVVTE